MEFYRVETNDFQGPYQNELELSLIEYLEMEDVLSRYDSRYEEYMNNHPSPMSRDRIIGDKFYKSDDYECYIFGFNSLEQLHKWFYLDKEIEYLKRYNFHISAYESTEIFYSDFQAIADKNSLKLINKLTIS